MENNKFGTLVQCNIGIVVFSVVFSKFFCTGYFLLKLLYYLFQSKIVHFWELGRRLVGDVDPEVFNVAGHMTPVPGGVGPMTVAMLLKNCCESAFRSVRPRFLKYNFALPY